MYRHVLPYTMIEFCMYYHVIPCTAMHSDRQSKVLYVYLLVRTFGTLSVLVRTGMCCHAQIMKSTYQYVHMKRTYRYVLVRTSMYC
jgi:hypothetical protein